MRARNYFIVLFVCVLLFALPFSIEAINVTVLLINMENCRSQK